MSNDGRAAFRDIPRGSIGNRFADLSPSTYDASARTVEVVLSTGAAVVRWYGTEILKIEAGAVNLERLSSCGVPIIDSHNVAGIDSVIGGLQRAWFAAGQLQGLLLFDDSDAGRKAEGLVARGMIRAVSIGYRVDEWEITDPDGDVIDPQTERLQYGVEYTFTAVRWTLLEASLVSVPADSEAVVRGRSADDPGEMIGGAIAAEILARMRLRERECARFCASLQSSPPAVSQSHDSNGFPYGLPRRRRYPGYGRF
jgi:hypothetical protein